MPDGLNVADRGAFRYADVERALVDHFMVPAANIGTFKARIRHFQKLGIAPAKAGKGRTIEYTVADVIAIAFCINLAELSVSPSSIKKIYDNCWERSLASLRLSKPGQTVSLFVVASFFSEALGIAGSSEELGNSFTYFGSEPPEIRQFDRGIIVNMTALLRGISSALLTADPSSSMASGPVSDLPRKLS